MNVRVLVVDDEEDFLNVLTERIESRSIFVSTALNV
jgi:DNA-binding NtrC family response regulator